MKLLSAAALIRMAAFTGVAAVGAVLAVSSPAQVSGNIGYGQEGGKARAFADVRNVQKLGKEDLPPTQTSMFVEASVLMNVKADEYVAVFGLSEEGATVQEAHDKVDAIAKQFVGAIKAMHLRDSDVYVDFIAQPKIYGFDVDGTTAKEKLAGFELKKNISVHFSDRDLLDRLVIAATEAHIYDLIKVDYVVKDVNAVQDKLMAEAAGVIKQKLARDQKLLGIQVTGAPTIYAERPEAHYPTDLYSSYTAADAETINTPRNMDRFSVQRMRKGRTFFFNGMDGNGFDKVVNPVIVEPMVQFTLYLKLKYEVANAGHGVVVAEGK